MLDDRRHPTDPQRTPIKSDPPREVTPFRDPFPTSTFSSPNPGPNSVVQTRAEVSELAASPTKESFFHYLYRGNTSNFGMGTVATCVSLPISGLVGYLAAHFGMDRFSTAWIVFGVSYVWYPVYWALNHFSGDRQIVKKHEEAGDTGARWRMWGNRITQLVIGEGIWIGLMVPGQILLAKYSSVSAGLGAMCTHLVSAALINCFILTPTRNSCRWLWRLDGPNRQQSIGKTVSTN